MVDNYKFKIKGNESFIIREGWLRKCIRNVEDEYSDNEFRKAGATEIFGVGANMVKSIRYWSISCRLVEEEKSGNRMNRKTKLGKLISEHDPYFDDIFTLWLIHYQLASNEEQATLWYLFFNEMDARKFTKEEMNRELLTIFNSKTDQRPSEKSFWDDCTSVIKTYTREHVDFDPEDNFVCPLTELGLVKVNNRNQYEKTMPSKDRLDKLVVLYAIACQIFAKENGATSGISLEDIITLPLSPGKVFNINRNRMIEYLELLKTAGYLNIVRTAGLNMIYLNGDIEPLKVVEKYYQA